MRGLGIILSLLGSQVIRYKYTLYVLALYVVFKIYYYLVPTLYI